MRTYQSFEPPTEEWVKTVCLVEKGVLCCRYLCMAPEGWSCAKHTNLKSYIDRKVANNTFRAKGDNCLGRGDRK